MQVIPVTQSLGNFWVEKYQLNLFNWHPLCQSIWVGRGSGIGPLDRLVAGKGGRKREVEGSFLAPTTPLLSPESQVPSSAWQSSTKKIVVGEPHQCCHPSSYVHPIPSAMHPLILILLHPASSPMQEHNNNKTDRIGTFSRAW